MEPTTLDITVPAANARAVVLEAGRHLCITNTQGKQVADLIAFNADDLSEFLSTNHTIVSIGSLFPRTGHTFRTNRRRPMLEIVHDDVGKHDLIIAACDPWRYELDFGVTGHRSCSDNFVEALRDYRIERARLPQPINFFQNMHYHPDGTVEFRESLARPGDRVVLRAAMNVVAAVSACPMDLNPISGFRVSELHLRVSATWPEGGTGGRR